LQQREKKMSNRISGAALAVIGLSASVLCSASTTPDGTLNDFLKAMQKKDRKALKGSIDWKALGKAMGADKEKPEKRDSFIEMMQTVYVEGFALGKQADNFKVGKVTAKGNTAQGGFMRMDKVTKKWTPATQFTLQKEGKNWMITNIGASKG
jgi:hypothetical protein